MKFASTANALLFLLPFTSLLAIAAPLNSCLDLSGTDRILTPATDSLISSLPSSDDSKTKTWVLSGKNPDIAYVGAAGGNYNAYLRSGEGEEIPVEKRQISPWPHFRECKKDDPRPECHHYKKRDNIDDVTGVDVIDEQPEYQVVKRRQISPWPHFRECKKDDPRPECHHYKRIDTEDAESFNVFAGEAESTPLETRQISPWPHFRECKPNDPRVECSRYQKPLLSPWPHFWQCIKNDPSPYCLHKKRNEDIGGR